jgi:hypothetical protein
MCSFPAKALLYTQRLLPEDRTKRVKDARTEAHKEIEEYRREKEEDFKAFEKEVCGMGHLNSHSKILTLYGSIQAGTGRLRRMQTKRLKRKSRRSRK